MTLAFGEIIKNFLNILYVGKDSHGLLVSIKDTMSLGMEPDGVVIIKGAQGITGTSRGCDLYDWHHPIADFSVYRPASGSVQRRSCDPFHPR